MNRKVYLLAVFLVAIAVSLITLKVRYGQSTVQVKNNPQLWRVSIVMHLTGQGARAKARLTLPQSDSHQTIYNEHFETNEMLFYIRAPKVTGNRLGYWKSEFLDGAKTAQYTFSAQLHPVRYEIGKNIPRPLNPAEFYPEA